ncbi:MAG: DegT/DnrJ/EryC1/StrS family aminotransferase, partial [Acidobacteriota bacterium]
QARDPRASHVYHLFVVRSPNRDALQAHLASLGIETAVHYPVPVHLMGAYRHLGYRAGAFPEAERASREVLSLPMYPELADAQIDRVADAVHRFRGAVLSDTR